MAESDGMNAIVADAPRRQVVGVPVDHKHVSERDAVEDSRYAQDCLITNHALDEKADTPSLIDIPEMQTSEISGKHTTFGSARRRTPVRIHSFHWRVVRADDVLVFSVTMISKVTRSAQPRWKQIILDEIKMLKASLFGP